MSSLLAWACQSDATVWPFLTRDPRSGAETFGEPYVIRCNWISGAGKNRNPNRTDMAGAEYLVKQTFYTEDQRPKFRDMIAIGVHVGQWQDAQANKVREVVSYDMAMFGEPDRPDFDVFV